MSASDDLLFRRAVKTVAEADDLLFDSERFCRVMDLVDLRARLGCSARELESAVNWGPAGELRREDDDVPGRVACFGRARSPHSGRQAVWLPEEIAEVARGERSR